MKTQVFLPFCLDSPTQTPHLSYNEIHRLTFRQVNTLCRNLVQTCLPSTLKVDIYAVPCVSCDRQYFDETGASLAKRISQHQFAVSRVHNNNASFCNHWDTGNQMDWSAARTVFPSETVSFISINLVLWVFYHTHIYIYVCEWLISWQQIIFQKYMKTNLWNILDIKTSFTKRFSYQRLIKKLTQGTRRLHLPAANGRRNPLAQLFRLERNTDFRQSNRKWWKQSEFRIRLVFVFIFSFLLFLFFLFFACLFFFFLSISGWEGNECSKKNFVGFWRVSDFHLTHFVLYLLNKGRYLEYLKVVHPVLTVLIPDKV